MGGYSRWRAGEFIQHALPELTPDERQMLIDGTHPECFDQLTGDEE